MIKRLSTCIREYKKQTILTPVCMVGEVVCECTIPLLTADLINSIQNGCDLRTILLYGLKLFVIAMLSLGFGALSGWFAAEAAAGFAKNLRHDLYYQVQSFSFANIDRFSTSSLVTRLTTDVTNIQNAFMMCIRIAVRGLPMFLPAGYTVWQELENYIKEKERARGYLHVMTPCIGTVNLYKTSGHWDHYRENMFPAMEMEGESYVLRPMNCPHHMMIYANRPHSYRDLPMRIGEIAHDFRYESSGTLKGIERGRHFCQNDAHLFCTPEQIKSEVANVCDLIFEVYKDFNITDYRCVLSLRDPADKKKYHDDDAMWNHAEQALREVLTELGIHFTEEIGEAAFYGPKLDVNVKPAVGAEYTLSTCQLDFCLPAKFHLTYVDKDGTEKTPVVLHRAILGSLDRFMAYLIEETKGKFPTWLAPTQVKVLPVSEKTLDYAEGVTEKLVEAGVRVVLDDDNQKIGYKIRAAQQVDRVPYMLVLGAKEAEAGNISVRDRKGETTTMELDEFITKVTTEIKTRSL